MKTSKRTHVIQISIVLLALFVTIFIAYSKGKDDVVNRYNTEEKIESELFTNVKGTTVTGTPQSSFSSKKTFKNLKIEIPSFASVYDDKKAESVKATQIISREDLDRDITSWLKKSYNKKEAAKITDHVEVWYRDNKIIDESYN
ncbi:MULTISPECIES: hypothetical protein [unclassified Lactococcus]|uniref:hypothetical protein n=1 Tax=unclassified Lactococcus TaxID=2643510 RepID=UPI0011CC91D7|nr:MULTISPECIES: hypothetical protein [unclassified Lactococcus]MQW23038.1 hypothetical protein [Lactococcus sp. dk101]TXK44383.1 hypothetical protein FVP42_05385 [Lactococcus sp. dk310]TXK50193.1 hypothetical protein FVP43_05355 [Lactococcus sp. dk322]